MLPSHEKQQKQFNSWKQDHVAPIALRVPGIAKFSSESLVNEIELDPLILLKWEPADSPLFMQFMGRGGATDEFTSSVVNCIDLKSIPSVESIVAPALTMHYIMWMAAHLEGVGMNDKALLLLGWMRAILHFGDESTLSPGGDAVSAKSYSGRVALFSVLHFRMERIILKELTRDSSGSYSPFSHTIGDSGVSSSKILFLVNEFSSSPLSKPEAPHHSERLNILGFDSFTIRMSTSMSESSISLSACWLSIGSDVLKMGQFELSRRIIEVALRDFRRVKDFRGISQSCEFIAQLDVLEGRPDKAISLLTSSEFKVALDASGDALLLAQMHTTLTSAYLSLGKCGLAQNLNLNTMAELSSMVMLKQAGSFERKEAIVESSLENCNALVLVLFSSAAIACASGICAEHFKKVEEGFALTLNLARSTYGILSPTYAAVLHLRNELHLQLRVNSKKKCGSSCQEDDLFRDVKLSIGQHKFLVSRVSISQMLSCFERFTSDSFQNAKKFYSQSYQQLALVGTHSAKTCFDIRRLNLPISSSPIFEPVTSLHSTIAKYISDSIRTSIFMSKDFEVSFSFTSFFGVTRVVNSSSDNLALEGFRSTTRMLRSLGSRPFPLQMIASELRVSKTQSVCLNHRRFDFVIYFTEAMLEMCSNIHAREVLYTNLETNGVKLAYCTILLQSVDSRGQMVHTVRSALSLTYDTQVFAAMEDYLLSCDSSRTGLFKRGQINPELTALPSTQLQLEAMSYRIFLKILSPPLKRLDIDMNISELVSHCIPTASTVYLLVSLSCRMGKIFFTAGFPNSDAPSGSTWYNHEVLIYKEDLISLHNTISKHCKWVAMCTFFCSTFGHNFGASQCKNSIRSKVDDKLNDIEAALETELEDALRFLDKLTISLSDTTSLGRALTKHLQFSSTVTLIIDPLLQNLPWEGINTFNQYQGQICRDFSMHLLGTRSNRKSSRSKFTTLIDPHQDDLDGVKGHSDVECIRPGAKSLVSGLFDENQISSSPMQSSDPSSCSFCLHDLTLLNTMRNIDVLFMVVPGAAGSILAPREIVTLEMEHAPLVIIADKMFTHSSMRRQSSQDFKKTLDELFLESAISMSVLLSLSGVATLFQGNWALPVIPHQFLLSSLVKAVSCGEIVSRAMSHRGFVQKHLMDAKNIQDAKPWLKLAISLTGVSN
jgi:hypothetical protein